MSKKKFSVNGNFKDGINTVKFLTERIKFVNSAEAVLPTRTDDFGVNKVAKSLHPKEQKLVISRVEEHADIAKSYYFKSESAPLAYFKAGQYLTFKLEIGNSVVTRSYSIASSPASALNGEYQITVKRISDGFVSDYILDNWKAGDKVTAYAPEGRYSIFVCGPGGLYKFLETELPKLELERKYIRFEVFSSGKKADEEPKEYSITVINRSKETVIKANSNETVLCAFERAGIVVPARCHTGECGFCRSKLVSGKVYIPEGEDKRRIADLQFNFIHPCCCFPESDLVVRIN